MDANEQQDGWDIALAAAAHNPDAIATIVEDADRNDEAIARFRQQLGIGGGE